MSSNMPPGAREPMTKEEFKKLFDDPWGHGIANDVLDYAYGKVTEENNDLRQELKEAKAGVWREAAKIGITHGMDSRWSVYFEARALKEGGK